MSRSRYQWSAGCTAGSSPTFRARTGCSSASAAPPWPIKAEFLVGNGRYRFDAAQTRAGRDGRPRPDASPSSGETQGWADGPSPFRPPAVTELLGNEIGNRILLVKPEYWIGSDPTCPICRPDDPFCEPRHVRLFRAQAAAGTPSTTRPRTGSGCGCRRSRSSRWSSSRSASNGSSSKSRNLEGVQTMQESTTIKKSSRRGGKKRDGSPKPRACCFD